MKYNGYKKLNRYNQHPIQNKELEARTCQVKPLSVDSNIQRGATLLLITSGNLNTLRVLVTFPSRQILRSTVDSVCADFINSSGSPLRTSMPRRLSDSIHKTRWSKGLTGRSSYSKKTPKVALENHHAVKSYLRIVKMATVIKHMNDDGDGAVRSCHPQKDTTFALPIGTGSCRSSPMKTAEKGWPI